MGKKGGKKHLKRTPAPKFWPIHRKEFAWAVRPRAGPHPFLRCLPLTIIVREMLGLAKTGKEAKTIISQGKIEVDGKTQREAQFSTGLMDVISIPDAETMYRILPSKKGFILHRIGKDEAGFKLCRIENKTVVKGGNVQLNLHDGRNILVRVEDQENVEKDMKTLDTLKMSIPDQEVTAHIKFVPEGSAIIVGGKNVGKHGKIVSVEQRPRKKRRRSLITIEDEAENRFQTILDYVFAVGETEPDISLPEVDHVG